MSKLVFTKENPSYEFHLTHEHKLIDFPKYILEKYEPADVAVDVILSCELIDEQNNCVGKPYLKTLSALPGQLEYSKESVLKTIEFQNAKTLKIKVENTEVLASGAEFTVWRKVDDLVEMEHPSDRFASHLKRGSNHLIVFSAKFGQGKTTFLKKFFSLDKRKEQYEIFHLFPVNYSVSTNRDIFEYIKVNILQQLGEKLWDGNTATLDEIETACPSREAKSQKHKELAQDLAIFIPKLVSLRLSLLPDFGMTHRFVASQSEGLIKSAIGLFDKYREHVQSNSSKVFEYLCEQGVKVGGLYESDKFTQMITWGLQHFKEQGKETVLIIDDLDRMDPEHIFRIMNVFSAHFDDPNYEGMHNKFGFDKIILVCDENNLRSIFAHRWGKETDFDGYFNKFFNSAPFRYENKEAIVRDYLIKEYATSSSLEKQFLYDLYLAEYLSLRDLIQLKKVELSDESEKQVEYLKGLPHLLCTIFAYKPSMNIVVQLTEQKQAQEQWWSDSVHANDLLCEEALFFDSSLNRMIGSLTKDEIKRQLYIAIVRWMDNNTYWLCSLTVK